MESLFESETGIVGCGQRSGCGAGRGWSDPGCDRAQGRGRQSVPSPAMADLVRPELTLAECSGERRVDDGVGASRPFVIDYPLCNDALQTCNQPQLVIPPLQTAFLIQAWIRCKVRLSLAAACACVHSVMASRESVPLSSTHPPPRQPAHSSQRLDPSSAPAPAAPSSHPDALISHLFHLCDPSVQHAFEPSHLTREWLDSLPVPPGCARRPEPSSNEQWALVEQWRIAAGTIRYYAQFAADSWYQHQYWQQQQQAGPFSCPQPLLILKLTTLLNSRQLAAQPALGFRL
jgi:hypothetical protein